MKQPSGSFNMPSDIAAVMNANGKGADAYDPLRITVSKFDKKHMHQPPPEDETTADSPPSLAQVCALISCCCCCCRCRNACSNQSAAHWHRLMACILLRLHSRTLLASGASPWEQLHCWAERGLVPEQGGAAAGPQHLWHTEPASRSSPVQQHDGPLLGRHLHTEPHCPHAHHRGPWQRPHAPHGPWCALALPVTATGHRPSSNLCLLYLATCVFGRDVNCCDCSMLLSTLSSRSRMHHISGS